MSTNAESGSIKDEDAKTAGMPLSDFVLQLEDYTPTVNNLLQCFFLGFFVIEYRMKKKVKKKQT